MEKVDIIRLDGA